MRFSALVALVVSALLVAAPAGAAPVFETPEALIAYAYQPYGDDSFPDDPFELFAPSLRKLVADANAAAGDSEVGVLDFDPFIDAQDFGDVSATIDSVRQSGDHARVAVTVANFGETARMDFALIETGAGWLIEDIIRIDGDYPWQLTELLAENPLLN